MSSDGQGMESGRGGGDGDGGGGGGSKGQSPVNAMAATHRLGVWCRRTNGSTGQGAASMRVTCRGRTKEHTSSPPGRGVRGADTPYHIKRQGATRAQQECKKGCNKKCKKGSNKRCKKQ